MKSNLKNCILCNLFFLFKRIIQFLIASVIIQIINTKFLFIFNIKKIKEMKKLKHILLILVFSAFASNLFAYKVIKTREHWGIWGGFSSVQERTEGHIGSDGNFVIDAVYLKCEGWGHDNCTHTAMAFQNDGGVLGEAGEAILNNMFAAAEQEQEGGTSSGSFSETHAIQQQDGSYRYFHYTASWNSNDPNTIEIEINEIFY
jgi:hypothetical protein